MRYYVLINNAEYEVEVDQERSASSVPGKLHTGLRIQRMPLHRPWQRQKPGLRTSTGACTCRDAAANTGSGCKACPVGTNGGEIVKALCPEPY